MYVRACARAYLRVHDEGLHNEFVELLWHDYAYGTYMGATPVDLITLSTRLSEVLVWREVSRHLGLGLVKKAS